METDKAEQTGLRSAYLDGLAAEEARKQRLREQENSEWLIAKRLQEEERRHDQFFMTAVLGILSGPLATRFSSQGVVEEATAITDAMLKARSA